ncbi:MAG: TIGR04282 family arsenosugar biosynthesis glycosyltransferase [Rhodospirillales bacterium]
MSPDNHLVAFVKAPRLGRVKTRLASDIGVVGAWTFYRRVLRAVLTRLEADRRWRCWLAITPDSAVEVEALWPRGWRRIGQGRGDLGRRMATVMRDLPPGPAVIVGTDVPAIGPDPIARAFRALGRHDAVFGPAADGGYWLVGLRRRPRLPAIFDGVRWSTEHALGDTLANMGALDVAMLEQLEDVDDGAAFARWRERTARAS